MELHLTSIVSTLPASEPPAKPMGTTLKANLLGVARQVRRFLARRRAQPGPAFAAMREFNDPTRRFLLERQTRDPGDWWRQLP
jgi:hypothetical protein